MGAARAQESPQALWDWSEQMKAKQTYIRVDLRTDGNKDTYAIGEPIVFQVKVDKPCYLTLLDFGTSGTITQIFPNQHQPNNRVEPGAEIRIPDPQGAFKYLIAGPASTTEMEVVRAVATATPLESAGQAEGAVIKGGFKTFRSPKNAVAGMKKELGQEVEWGSADIRFKVRDR
jgi:hypothetical protein